MQSSWTATARCLKKSDTCIMPVSIGCIHGPEKRFRRINESGMKSVLITNQSGVERGYFKESTVHEVHQVLQQELQQCEAHMDAIYYCPHVPETQLRLPQTETRNDSASGPGAGNRSQPFLHDRRPLHRRSRPHTLQGSDRFWFAAETAPVKWPNMPDFPVRSRTSSRTTCCTPSTPFSPGR